MSSSFQKQSSYMPLALKYRPKIFEDVTGQGATSVAIRNSITLNKHAHAVVFSGIRGVGKTTLARIYAKSLVCEATDPQAKPCCQCQGCKLAESQDHEDIIEIDGASNTSVDHVRSLSETLSYVPQRANRKIIIIDEVHMLSTSAFNALLKTIEEPPEHIFFVFATTELEKIPRTVRSRCQVYKLTKIKKAEIFARIQKILEAENYGFEPEALEIIASQAQGSMRDAMSFTDQVLAIGGYQKLDKDSVLLLNPALDTVVWISQFLNLIRGDLKSVAARIDTLETLGVDWEAAILQWIQISRDLLMLKLDIPYLIGDPDELESFKNKEIPVQSLQHFMVCLKRLLGELKGTALDRILVENYLFLFAASLQKNTQENLQKKKAPALNTPSRETLPAAPEAVPQPHLKQQAPPPEVPSAKSTIGSWRECLSKLQKEFPLDSRLWEDLVCREYSPEKISLFFDPDSLCGRKILKDPQYMKNLEKALQDHADFKGTFSLEMNQNPQKDETVFEQKQKEKAENLQKKEQKLRNSPETHLACEIFHATIDNVEIHD